MRVQEDTTGTCHGGSLSVPPLTTDVLSHTHILARHGHASQWAASACGYYQHDVLGYLIFFPRTTCLASWCWEWGLNLLKSTLSTTRINGPSNGLKQKKKTMRSVSPMLILRSTGDSFASGWRRRHESGAGAHHPMFLLAGWLEYVPRESGKRWASCCFDTARDEQMLQIGMLRPAG